MATAMAFPACLLSWGLLFSLIVSIAGERDRELDLHAYDKATLQAQADPTAELAEPVSNVSQIVPAQTNKSSAQEEAQQVVDTVTGKEPPNGNSDLALSKKAFEADVPEMTELNSLINSHEKGSVKFQMDAAKGQADELKTASTKWIASSKKLLKYAKKVTLEGLETHKALDKAHQEVHDYSKNKVTRKLKQTKKDFNYYQSPKAVADKQ